MCGLGRAVGDEAEKAVWSPATKGWRARIQFWKHGEVQP